MGISLEKRTGISLTKGASISLEKAGKQIEHLIVGLNWGAIEKKALWGLVRNTETVDLDGSLVLFDGANRQVDLVYYNNLSSLDKAIKHSGDDREGDLFGDDDKDNETININLPLLNSSVTQIFFFLTSYKGQSFDTIPYSKIRIWETENGKIKEAFASFNLSADSTYKGKTGMILGKLTRKSNSNWEFNTIGEACPAQKVTEMVAHIQTHYLS
jgi:tellurium resistance protein TerZ